MAVTTSIFQVKIDDATAARLEVLRQAVSQSTGLTATKADVFRLGLDALEREYGISKPKKTSRKNSK